jgi:pyruvate/2-oxoglutarate dehydrogenase complex dihydrolipoamide dehydrogenase (E3) component
MKDLAAREHGALPPSTCDCCAACCSAPGACDDELAVRGARGQQEAKPDYAAVPSVVFSSPQVAYVGKHEQAAVEEYGDVDVYTSVSTCAPVSVAYQPHAFSPPACSRLLCRRQRARCARCGVWNGGCLP